MQKHESKIIYVEKSVKGKNERDKKLHEFFLFLVPQFFGIHSRKETKEHALSQRLTSKKELLQFHFVTLRENNSPPEAGQTDFLF